MDYLKRIVSLPEKFFFEISIESILVNLPLDCFIQITVKRNQKKKEKSPKYPYSPSNPLVIFDSKLTFPVTLYKTNSSYADKLYFFRLVQITHKKTIKNGKAKFNISSLAKSSPLSITLPLKGCSDSKALVNLTLSMTRIIKTESLNVNFFQTFKEQDDVRGSRSFDQTPYSPIPQDQKLKDREKYLRRIEKVNQIHNSPMSALILQDSDLSSCGSPTSPYKSPDSPFKPEASDSFFTITPIKIDFDELSPHKSPDPRVPQSAIKSSPESSPEAVSKTWEDFIGSERGSPIKTLPSDLHEISEESFNKHSDHSTSEEPESPASSSQTQSKPIECNSIPSSDLPISSYSADQPIPAHKANIEIASDESQSKCCRCIIY